MVLVNLRHEMNHLPLAAAWLHWAIERWLRPDWQLESKMGGPNSFWLHKPGDPREFHFRWWPSDPDVVQVFNAFRNGRRLGKIRTQDDVLRFVVAVNRGRRWP